MNPIVAGVAAFAAGFALSLYELRRISSRIGPTWDDWNTAPRIGGRWASAIATATAFFTFLGFYGTFLPVWVRAAILGAIFGVCVPFFVKGVRLKLRARG